MIISAIITFNNHFNPTFTLSDLSALDIILNQWITIIKIAAMKAKAFKKDKTKNSKEFCVHCKLSTSESDHDATSNFKTDHKIHTHQKNKMDHSNI